MANDKKTAQPDKAAPEPSDLELIQAAEAFEKRHAAGIARRMRLGLTEEQALACEKQQALEDARNAATQKTPSTK